MKILALLLSIITIHCYSQKSFADFHYSGDTLFIQGKTLIPGDTIHLGFGSGTNKQFLFISQQTSDMRKYSTRNEFLPYQFANSYLIFKRIDIVDKKQSGVPLHFVAPIFGTTLSNERLEWMISFANAINSKEVIL
jgi:hypothetical protein